MTSPPSPPTWAVVAGGGTGGHVLPAVAIAQALVGRGHRVDSIRFIGSERGMERQLVPAAGFEVTLLPGRGVVRRLAWSNVGAVLGLGRAAIRAVALVRQLRPAVVIAVGGYASVACVVAAAVWRVPLVVAEQNAVPGLANRLAGRVCRASAVSFPGTDLPRAVLTGNPVRREMLSVDRSSHGRRAARAALGLDADAVVVVVAGGSLGARTLNDATVGVARTWADRSGWALLHVVGRRDWDRVTYGGPAGPQGLTYRPVAFEEHMERVYAAADLAVHRAGASTVAELAVAGLASILVPLPGSPGDHQGANARRMAEAGAAVVVADAELDAGRLATEIDRLVGDPARLLAMGAAARTLAHPGAADAVAALAELHARP